MRSDAFYRNAHAAPVLGSMVLVALASFAVGFGGSFVLGLI